MSILLILLKKMNYNAYAEILEYIPNIINNFDNLKENDIFKYVNNFLKEINCNNFLISLSGGVDSMVFCIISKLIKEIGKNINFSCCHLNYNNRTESVEEMNFLIEWCNYHDFKLDIKNITHIHRGDGNRNDYEEETRNIRYGFYKDLIEKYKYDGVVLAHHKDDYSENVFNNIMRGNSSILNLGVFKEVNIINNVKVLRPMLNFIKKDIYDISEQYQIPYFLDTTPKWSCRGKMRNEIFPKCDNCYGKIFMKNLHLLGIQSESVNNVIYKHLIDPILNSIFYGKFGFKILKTSCLKEQIILESVINSITFRLGLKTIRKKNIKTIIEKFNDEIEINILKGYKCFILKECILFIEMEKIVNFFKDKKFLDLNFMLLNNIKNVNLYNDLLDGIIYYLINSKTCKISTKGNRKNRLTKININYLINRYIPNLYFENDNLDDEENNYVLVDLSSIINL